ncbi:MAG: M56 family metallopeptidase, partial [Planctomycetota bacterium]
MSLTLLEYVIGNTVFALPLALLAWSVGRTQRHPGVTHLLWALVLVRLLLPPIAAVPWLSLRMPLESLVARSELLRDELLAPENSSPDPSASQQDSQPIPEPSASVSADSISLKPSNAGEFQAGPLTEGPVNTRPSTTRLGSPIVATTDLAPRIFREERPPTVPAESSLAETSLGNGAVSLLTIWAIGSGSLILLTVSRLWRFQHLLRQGTKPADQLLQRLAADTAAVLGGGLNARVFVTRAQTPPFVWWLGMRPQIVLPKGIIEELPLGEQRLVLAHELAHIRRGDHLVRWLEWAALALLWWNPLAWVAR